MTLILHYLRVSHSHLHSISHKTASCNLDKSHYLYFQQRSEAQSNLSEMTQLVLGRAESEQHPRLLPQLLPAFLVPCPHYLPLKPPRAAGANALTGMVDCLTAGCRISGSEFTAFQWLRSFILQYPCGSRHPVS